MVIGDDFVVAAPSEPNWLNKGSAAIPTSARNHTANLVPEFCLPSRRSRAHASRAITIPRTVQLSIRAAENWANECTSFPERLRDPDWRSAAIISLSPSLSRFLFWSGAVAAAALTHWLRSPGLPECSRPATHGNPRRIW